MSGETATLNNWNGPEHDRKKLLLTQRVDMKISFMSKFSEINFEYEESIIDFFNKMDSVGYFGVLFVYHSTIKDYWLQCARHLNKKHKFKFIIAMRTYAISPEYCGMMVESFNDIQADRLAINVVAGDIHQAENSISDVVFISDKIDSVQKRTEYTSEWLNKFVNLKNLKHKPYLIVSGYSDTSTKNATMYADDQLMMLSTYKSEMMGKVGCSGKMVSVPVVIESSDLIAEESVKRIYGDNMMMIGSCIYGTSESVHNKIKDLEKIGVTNVLLSPAEPKYDQALHAMAKGLIGEINANL